MNSNLVKFEVVSATFPHHRDPSHQFVKHLDSSAAIIPKHFDLLPFEELTSW